MLSKLKNTVKDLSILCVRQHEKQKNDQIGFHSPHYASAQFEFIHIPKTAGTSIGTAISALNGYGGNYHWPWSMEDYRKYLVGEQMDVKYITFLRNPVDRVWSFYQMARSIPSSTHYHQLTRDFKYFMDNVWEAQNMYTQYFSMKVRCTHLDLQDVQSAKSLLQAFWFVGLFENLDNDFAKLGEKIKKEAGTQIAALPHKRKAESYPLPTREQAQIIQSYNVFDSMLYDYVKSEVLKS